MLLAAYRDTPYDIVLFLHILTVIIAMAGAVAHPLLFQFEMKRDEPDMVGLLQRVAPASRVYAIVLAVTGILGFGLISMSEDVVAWGDTWVWLGILLWVAANGVMHGMLLPAERAVAEGDESAMKRVMLAGQIATVLVLVLLYLMVFKPGGGGL